LAFVQDKVTLFFEDTIIL